ncbi:hypothetical protein [Parasphingorhabdus sp.]
MPRVDSEFLEGVLESIRRRSKALKHRNAKPAIERFLEVQEDHFEERIEIRIDIRPRQTLRLKLWSDRFIDVWAAESVWQAGWKFQYQKSGRFVGGIDGRKIVGAIEESLSAMFEMTADDTSELEQTWKPLLASGPSAL